MSEYTVELRNICEAIAGHSRPTNYADVEDIIQGARGEIFNFDYPIFDESYKSVLETKIIKHYYTREIGLETYGLWKLKLDTKMNEIMPYYNELYRSTEFEYDPLNDIDVTTTIDDTKRDTGTIITDDTTETENTTKLDRSTASGQTGKTINKNSNTPQGEITDLENGRYMSSASIVSGENNGTETLLTNDIVSGRNKYDGEHIRDLTTTDEYIKTVKGKIGANSYSKYIAEFRKNIINVDMMIIDELSELFMLIY